MKTIVTKGRYVGSYYHEYFRKNRPNLCALIDPSEGEKRMRAMNLIKEHGNINRLKKNQTKVSDIENNVPNKSEQIVTTTRTIDSEEKALKVPVSVQQEEIVQPPITFLNQEVQDPLSTTMTKPSTILSPDLSVDET